MTFSEELNYITKQSRKSLIIDWFVSSGFEYHNSKTFKEHLKDLAREGKDQCSLIFSEDRSMAHDVYEFFIEYINYHELKGITVSTSLIENSKVRVTFSW